MVLRNLFLVYLRARLDRFSATSTDKLQIDAEAAKSQDEEAVPGDREVVEGLMDVFVTEVGRQALGLGTAPFLM